MLDEKSVDPGKTSKTQGQQKIITQARKSKLKMI